jgi:WD40 repeat protein
MLPTDETAPPTAAIERPPNGYDIFISYSSGDRRLVQALQRRLEQFANPWYRRRRWRVFHDVSNLSATPDIAASIHAALTGSAWLILVLSPEAARSRWVAQEMEWWLAEKAPKPLDRLLIAVTNGDPPWTDHGPDDGTLPKPLHGKLTSEPRWVDLRDLRASMVVRRARRHRREGLTIAAADFAAAILEKPKDVVYGMATRRYRRNIQMAVAAAAVSALAAAAALWGFANANQERRRAEEQARIAISRQLLAESSGMQALQPGLARQLTATAYRTAPTDQAYGSLLQSPALPGMIQLSGDGNAVAYAPSGETLAVATDTEILFIDTTTDATVSTLASFGRAATSMAFDRTGSRFVGVGADGSVHVWDVRDRARPRELGSAVIDGSIRQIALSADGMRLATVEDGQTLRLWDLRSVDDLKPVTTVKGAGTTGSPVVALTDDGRILATTDENSRIDLYSLADLRAPRRLAKLSGHTGVVETLDFNPSGTVLASGGGDDTVRLWGVGDPSVPHTLPALVGHTGKVAAVVFNHDGRRLASADWTGMVRIWDTTDPIRPPLVTELSGHRDFVNGVAFNPDASVVATASSDDTVRLWNVRNPGKSVPRAVLRVGTSHVLAFDPRAPRLVAGSELQRWDLSGPTVPQPDGPLVQSRPGSVAAAFSSDGRVLAADAGAEGVRFWDTEAPDDIRRAGRLPIAAGTVSALAFSPRDRTLAIAGADVGVFLSDVTDPEDPGPPRTVPVERPEQPPSVSDVAVSDDGTRLAVTTSTGFDVWNVRDWRRSTPTRVAAVRDVGQVQAISFAPGSTRLATAGGDGVIRVWDYGGDKWRQVANITGHRGGVNALAYAPDGQMLASGGEDETVRLWRTRSEAAPSPITSLTGHATGIRQVAISADGRTLISVDINGYAHVWQLDAPTLLEHLCQHRGPDISKEQWTLYVGDTEYQPPCP